jgi:hypothetical protein
MPEALLYSIFFFFFLYKNLRESGPRLEPRRRGKPFVALNVFIVIGVNVDALSYGDFDTGWCDVVFFATDNESFAVSSI